MMLRLTFSLLLSTSVAQSFAQKDSILIEHLAPSVSNMFDIGLMIVPFKNQLYNSNIDEGIAKATELSQQDILFEFKEELMFHMVRSARKERNHWGIVHLDETYAEMKGDMECLMNQTSYKFTSKEEIKHGRVVRHTTHRPSKRKDLAGGQLMANQSSVRKPQKKTIEKFMKAQVKNKEMLDYLSLRYNVKYFLFINELDLMKIPSRGRGSLSNDAKRIAKVHFTIMDSEGNETYSGVEKMRFSSEMATPNRIGVACFTKLSEIIVSSLPDPKKGKG